MEIKIQKRGSVHAASKDSRLRLSGEVDLDEERIIGSVCVQVWGSAQEPRSITIEPEVLERAAAIVEKVRHECGDLRSLCVEHGYYESGRPDYQCPTCRIEKHVQGAAAPAEAAHGA